MDSIHTETRESVDEIPDASPFEDQTAEADRGTGSVLAEKVTEMAGCLSRSSSAEEVRKILITQIRTDAGTQTRAAIDTRVVADYADEIRAGADFPPITVFTTNGTEFVLADGFHRLAARAKNGEIDILADVRHGTVTDALDFALRSNHRHGVRRKNADKKCAVRRALENETLSKLSSRELAEICGVSHTFVQAIRDQLETVSTSTVIGSDGKTYALKKRAFSEADENNVHEKPAPTVMPAQTPAAASDDRFVLADGTLIQFDSWSSGWITLDDALEIVADMEHGRVRTSAEKGWVAQDQRLFLEITAAVNRVTGDTLSANAFRGLRQTLEIITDLTTNCCPESDD
jgi:hypothetical protein